MGSDRICIWEPAEFGDARIERFHFLVIPLEQGQKGGLGAGCPFDTAETEVVAGPSEVAEVPEKLLNPEAGAFAYGGQLSGLVVSETQRWE